MSFSHSAAKVYQRDGGGAKPCGDLPPPTNAVGGIGGFVPEIRCACRLHPDEGTAGLDQGSRPPFGLIEIIDIVPVADRSKSVPFEIACHFGLTSRAANNTATTTRSPATSAIKDLPTKAPLIVSGAPPCHFLTSETRLPLRPRSTQSEGAPEHGLESHARQLQYKNVLHGSIARHHPRTRHDHVPRPFPVLPRAPEASQPPAAQRVQSALPPRGRGGVGWT